MMEVERPPPLELKEEQQLLMESEPEPESEEEEDTSALVHTRGRDRASNGNNNNKMTATLAAEMDLDTSGSGSGSGSSSDSDAAAAAATEDEGEALAPHHRSIFFDPTQVSDHATGSGAESQVTEVGGQKENTNDTSGAQGKEIEKQDNISTQETNHSSSNGKLENGSHSNGVHEISSNSETMIVADGLKLITTIREGRHILPNWSGSLDVSSGSTSTSEVREIEVEKDEIVTKGEVKVEEYDLEKILDEQETHDLYCPNCNSCITRRVILKKRKRTIRSEARKETPKRPQLVEPSANVPNQTIEEDSPEVFRCLSCFTFFIPTGHRGGKDFPT